MQKIFIDKQNFNKNIILEKEKAKHFLKVLRMNVGDELIVVCDQQKYLFNIINTNPCTISLIKKINNKTKNNFEINVIFAAIKTKNIELAIKKATELNADNFYIYYFEHSQGNEKYNIERLKQISLSASEQSNRDNLMNIEIINKEKLINILKQNDINLIAHFDDNANYISNVLNTKHHKIGILIGPEGGFSKSDLSLLNCKNNCIINLTKTILKSETALFYALSIINEIKLRGE